MKRLSFILLLLLPLMASAQGVSTYFDASHSKVDVKKMGDSVRLEIVADFSGFKPKTTELLSIVPVIRSNDGATELRLDSLAIVGPNRMKSYKRHTALKNDAGFDLEQYAQVIPAKEMTQEPLTHIVMVSYAEWMKDSHLGLSTYYTGCAGCNRLGEEALLLPRLFRTPYQPTYQVSYIVPEVEAVKMRADSLSAYFNYKVGRHELLPDFKNNASELARVREFLTPLLNDKNIKLSGMEINGYASPEDTQPRNQALSERRAATFKNYLVKEYRFSPSELAAKGRGEDWGGLQRAVQSSTIAHKDKVLEIINSVPKYDARDAKIRAIDGGVTYKFLLNEFYPPLRRNDFKVRYVVKPFSVQEGKEIFKRRPEHLSLDEMFRISETYAKGSPEFNELFTVAARLFPKNYIAKINVAAMLLQQPDKVDEAYAILKDGFGSSHPAGVNNLGIAYALKGMYKEAEALFTSLAEKGDRNATANLEELKKVLADR